MSQSGPFTAPLIESVLHPSDFSAASEPAFAHALKVALIARASFTVLHVSKEMTADWMDFPGVRETLERWGLLPEGSPRSAVADLGIDVRKIVAQHDDPVKSVLHYLEAHAADLIVLGTNRRDGRATWLRKSVSEPIARKSGEMSLFVPEGVSGFVSLADGSVSLRSILIPVAPTPSAQPAIEAAARLVRRLDCPTGAFTLLHVVGGPGTMPTLICPEVPGWEWRRTTRAGDVIDGIVTTAADANANLIVMSTDGRDGFLDALRGSHSERVLRRASCPLLAIPERSSAATLPAR